MRLLAAGDAARWCGELEGCAREARGRVKGSPALCPLSDGISGFHSIVDTGARLVCNCMGMRQVSANVSRGPVFEGKESVMSDEDQ